MPHVCGVGFPFLLATVAVLGCGGASVAAFGLAVFAGVLEDGLSSLPPMTSVSYFLLIVFLVRRSGMPRLVMGLGYPCYQVWLSPWVGGFGGNFFGRVALAFPIGAVTVSVAGVILFELGRRAAIDERD